jgi:hypothetical protein
MQLSLEISDELAARLFPRRERLPDILDLGLRELDAGAAAGYSGLSEVLEFLVGLPAPEQILALRPSPDLQARIDALLERSRESALTNEEELSWHAYQYIEHLVRKAKISAAAKIKAA